MSKRTDNNLTTELEAHRWDASFEMAALREPIIQGVKEHDAARVYRGMLIAQQEQRHTEVHAEWVAVRKAEKKMQHELAAAKRLAIELAAYAEDSARAGRTSERDALLLERADVRLAISWAPVLNARATAVRQA